MIHWMKARRRKRPSGDQLGDIALAIVAALLLVAIHAAFDAFGVQTP